MSLFGEPKEPLLLAEFILTDEQLRAIGCLSVESTHLDMYITGIIVDICKFDDIAMEVFVGSRLTIEPKAKMMRDLLWPHLEDGSELKESFKLIYDDIKDLIAKRNTVIHGNWGSDSKQTLAALATFTRQTDSVARRRGVANTVAAKEVIELAHRFARRQMDLMDWYIEYLEATRTFPRKDDESPPTENQTKDRG